MPTNFQQLIWLFIDLISAILPLLASLSLLVFVWGLAKFIMKVGGDEKAVGEGKNLMKWGLLALFLMVSFMGVISFFQRDIGLGDRASYPLLPGLEEGQ